MSGYHIPKFRNRHQLYHYIANAVGRAQHLPHHAVNDRTPVGEAGLELGSVLCIVAKQAITMSTGTTVKELTDMVWALISAPSTA